MSKPLPHQHFQFGPPKKALRQARKPDPGTWWLDKDRAAFAAEVAKRERERQAEADRVCYAAKAQVS